MQLIGRLASCPELKAGEVTLWADATLYERHRLASRLGLSEAQSDPELILAAYQRWGRECLIHLNGDFRFVIEDRARGSIFAVVDHMAVRPLFYAEHGGALMIAGSVRELVDAMGGEPEIDETLVASLLVQRGYFSTTRTLCRSIRKVPFAHGIEWKDGQATAKRYWHPENTPPLKLRDPAAYVERGREVFSAAVRDRVHASETIGAHVSGGLDSSAIATLATRMRREKGQSDPIGFAWHHWDKDDHDPTKESGWLAAVQREIGIEVSVAMPNAAETRETFGFDLVADYDVGNLFQERLVQREAQARGIGLILSGWGGDEGLTFNGRYLASYLLKRGRLRALARLHRDGGLAGLAKGSIVALREWAKPPETTPSKTHLERTLASQSLLDKTTLELAWTPTAKSPRAFQVERIMSGYLSERMEVLAQSGDKHAVRYTFPMLDRRVIEFALSVPAELFWKGTTRRWLFREMMQGVLPESVLANQSKFEGQRVDDLLRAINGAFEQIGSEIEGREDFARAHFLDMPRLREQLRDPSNHPLAPMRLAVQLLDL